MLRAVQAVSPLASLTVELRQCFSGITAWHCLWRWGMSPTMQYEEKKRHAGKLSAGQSVSPSPSIILATLSATHMYLPEGAHIFLC